MQYNNQNKLDSLVTPSTTSSHMPTLATLTGIFRRRSIEQTSTSSGKVISGLAGSPYELPLYLQPPVTSASDYSQPANTGVWVSYSSAQTPVLSPISPTMLTASHSSPRYPMSRSDSAVDPSSSAAVAVSDDGPPTEPLSNIIRSSSPPTSTSPHPSWDFDIAEMKSEYEDLLTKISEAKLIRQGLLDEQADLLQDIADLKATRKEELDAWGESHEGVETAQALHATLFSQVEILRISRDRTQAELEGLLVDIRNSKHVVADTCATIRKMGLLLDAKRRECSEIQARIDTGFESDRTLQRMLKAHEAMIKASQVEHDQLLASIAEQKDARDLAQAEAEQNEDHARDRLLTLEGEIARAKADHDEGQRNLHQLNTEIESAQCERDQAVGESSSAKEKLEGIQSHITISEADLAEKFRLIDVEAQRLKGIEAQIEAAEQRRQAAEIATADALDHARVTKERVDAEIQDVHVQKAEIEKAREGIREELADAVEALSTTRGAIGRAVGRLHQLVAEHSGDYGESAVQEGAPDGRNSYALPEITHPRKHHDDEDTGTYSETLRTSESRQPKIGRDDGAATPQQPINNLYNPLDVNVTAFTSATTASAPPASSHGNINIPRTANGQPGSPYPEHIQASESPASLAASEASNSSPTAFDAVIVESDGLCTPSVRVQSREHVNSKPGTESQSETGVQSSQSMPLLNLNSPTASSPAEFDTPSLPQGEANSEHDPSVALPSPSYATSITPVPDQHDTRDDDSSPIVPVGPMSEPALSSSHQVNTSETNPEGHPSAIDPTLPGPHSMKAADKDPTPTPTTSSEVPSDPVSVPGQVGDSDHEATLVNLGDSTEPDGPHTLHAAAATITSGALTWPIAMFETIRVLDYSVPLINDENDLLDFRRIKVTVSQ